MHQDGILAAFAEADQRDEELIAVYHSHPTSEAIPSEADRSVPDIAPAQLIVSMTKDEPVQRAWRLSVPFIGQRDAREVLLHVSDDGQPFLGDPPAVPWSLMMGNVVQISYSRYGHAQHRTIQATVIGHENDDNTVRLETRQKIDPKQIPIERIKATAVVSESEAAKRMRSKMVLLARHMAHLISAGDVDEVPQIVAVLAAAFPTSIDHHAPVGGGK